MSVKKVATNQPDFFQFSEENLNKAKKIIKKYPEKKQERIDAFVVFSPKAK